MATSSAEDIIRESDDIILHDRVKRIMYKKYLQAFIRLTQKYYNTVIIDGFAGKGRFGKKWPGALENNDSPLIALMISLNYYFKIHHRENVTLEDVFVQNISPNIPVEQTQQDDIDNNFLNSIHLMFIEKDTYDALKKNVLKLLSSFFQEDGMIEVNEEENVCEYRSLQKEYPITCTIFNKSFQDFDPPSVGYGTQCLTFVDPLAYKHIPMKHILKFCGPRKRLLIKFNSSYVTRLISRKPRRAAELFGIEPPDVQNEDNFAHFIADYVPTDANGGNIQGCATRYETLLLKKRGNNYSLKFEMVSSTNEVLYHLIFVADHISDFKAMKESMNRCTQSENELRMSDYDVIKRGRRVTFENKQNADDVADVIFQEFQSKTVPLSEVEMFVWLKTPYVYRKTPLKMLVRDGKITRVSDLSGNPPRILGTFPDHTHWTLTFTDMSADLEVVYIDKRIKLGYEQNTDDVADAIFKKFHSNTVLLSDVEMFVRRSTPFVFRKKPLNKMCKDGRIVCVLDSSGNPPKNKNTFPDRTCWSLTFANKV